VGDLGPFELDTIVVGDCLDVMRQMPGGCIDLVFADPPYGMGKGGWDVLADEWIPESARILRSGGTLYMTSMGDATLHLVPHLDRCLRRLSWVVWQRVIYHSRKDRWPNRHEDLLHYTSGSPWTFNAHAVQVPTTSQAMKRRGIATKVPASVWYFPEFNLTCPERVGHPTQKPEALLKRVMLASSNEGELVFDPFMGSGTTAVVARKLGRHYFGCDINPEYVAMANERLSRVQLALF